MPEIRQIGPGDEAALEAFFAALRSDERAVRFFRPHPFDAVTARSIASRAGRDCYFGMFEGAEMLAYGMLRGWDEGYEVPFFGIGVLARERGRGLAARMLDWAIAEASSRGASRIGLKVYRDNKAAIKVYERAGFVLAPYEPDPTQLVGYLDLPVNR